MAAPPSQELLQALAGKPLFEWVKPFNDPEALAVEHAALFTVPSEPMVSPYESCWRDTLEIDNTSGCSAYFEPGSPAYKMVGCLRGPSATLVEEAYRQAGLELNPASHDLPDHIAVELEFLGRLYAQGKEEEARQFYQAHLQPWVFDFLKKLKENPSSAFYRRLAQTLESFLPAIP